MAKKTEEPKKEETKDLKLTAEEYWEWMTSIERMGRKKAEVVASELEAKMMTLEYQNKAMQIQLHNKTRLEAAKRAVENSVGEYKTLKEKIEGRLGVSLNDKAIDEFTFEVKEIPTNN